MRSLEKPNPAQWYGVQGAGKCTLSKVVGKLLISAELDGYFTNHSLRRNYKIVSGQGIKEFTGHSSDALDKYQVISNDQRRHMSNVIQGNIDEN